MTVGWRSALLREVAQLGQVVRRGALSDVEALLYDLMTGALKVVPGAQYAGTTVAARGGSGQTISATHPSVTLLDEIQQRHAQGPCLFASEEQWTRIDDLADENRWPAFCRDAAEQTAIRSVMTLQFIAERRTKGTLSFYSEEPHAFDDDAVELGQICATYMGLAWSMARREEQFLAALASRDAIGQAKGVLMERFDVDATHAFELLKRLSQSCNIPLANIADRLVGGERPS